MLARGALKKLVGAARHWCGADQPPDAPAAAVDENVAAGLRAMGVSAEDIAAELERQAAQTEAAEQAARPLGFEADFEVHEDCWESVLFFLRVQTQWRHKGMEGRRAGLDNTAVEATMRLAGVKAKGRAALLEDLQVMEKAVLQADFEKAEASQEASGQAK